MTNTIERTRIGDKLRVVKEMPARVEFSEILESTRLECDDDHNFFDCDGLEHEITSARDFVLQRSGFWDTDDNISEAIENARGYFWRGGGWNENSVITIDRSQAARDGWGNGYNKGASKQVQAENIAASIRRTTDWIRKVYTDQVSAVGIVCDFTAPDGEEYHASCWGFESENPWNDEYIESERETIAGEVAFNLRAAGFEVVGEPDSTQSIAVQNHKNRNGVNGDNWKGDYQSRRDAIARHNRRHNRKK